MSPEGISGSPAEPRVVRARNPSPMTLDGTRTFVVGRRRPVVIDPGPDDAAHREAVIAALRGAKPVAILLTHAHDDHAGGAPALSRAVGAPIHMARGLQEEDGTSPPGAIRMADGERVQSDAGPLYAVATPGHAPDHLAWWWPGGRALFVGDLMMGEGDTTLVAPPEGDLSAYLRSLDRVEEIAPAVLYPAHGPPLADPAAAVERYRAHRRARIAQVREALERLPGADPDRLVEAVYGPGLHPALRHAAAGSVRAIMEYLERGA
jgi:glyoxylase-like metal-dependent hydrolase (beta-lactamase superfamily II)